MKGFSGVIPALVSPSDRDGAVGVKVIPTLLAFLRDAGCGGFFVCGSTGEGLLMNAAERKAMAEAVVGELVGEAPVVIHVGALDVRESCELARHAREIGADGVASVMPFYYPYSLPEVRAYYNAVARAAQLPLVIYVRTRASERTFAPEEFVDAVASVPHLYGMKYTAMSLHEMQTMQLLTEGRWRTFGGWDELALPYMTMGVDGLIGANYNYVPEPYVAIHKAFLMGEMDRAMALQETMTRFLSAVTDVTPAVRAKAGLYLRGLDVGRPRGVLQWPNRQGLQRMKRLLDGVGLKRIG